MNYKSNRFESQSIITGKKKNADFYITPPYAIETLLKREKFIGSVLEPCCGNGSISNVLKKHKYKVLSYDINGDKYGFKKANFLDRTKVIDNIITNPPFNQVFNMVQHGLKLYNKKMAFLIRLAFVETQKRYNFIFKNNPPKIIPVKPLESIIAKIPGLLIYSISIKSKKVPVPIKDAKKVTGIAFS